MIPKSAGTGDCKTIALYHHLAQKTKTVPCADKIGALMRRGKNKLAEVIVGDEWTSEKGIGRDWWPEDHFGLCWFTRSASLSRRCWDAPEWDYWDRVSGGIGKVTAVTLLQNEYMSQLGLSYATGRAGAMRFFDTAFRVSPACLCGGGGVCTCTCTCTCVCVCFCAFAR